MRLLIRYRGGECRQAITLAGIGDRLRVAMPGCDDAVEFRWADGKWLTEGGEPVEIQAEAGFAPSASMEARMAPASHAWAMDGALLQSREMPLGERGVPQLTPVRRGVSRIDIRQIFAYSEEVANCRKCRVSFTDSENITHAVEVAAASLFEAAALALGEFRRCGFADALAGPATRLTVSVEAPSTTHELPVRKVAAWLESGGRSPSEQAVKVRLRALFGGA